MLNSNSIRKQVNTSTSHLVVIIKTSANILELNTVGIQLRNYVISILIFASLLGLPNREHPAKFKKGARKRSAARWSSTRAFSMKRFGGTARLPPFRWPSLTSLVVHVHCILSQQMREAFVHSTLYRIIPIMKEPLQDSM